MVSLQKKDLSNFFQKKTAEKCGWAGLSSEMKIQESFIFFKELERLN